MDQARSVPQVLWRPQHPEDTPISIYRKHINDKFHVDLKNSQELHKWSVSNPHEFWIDLYSYTKIIPPLPSSMKYAYEPNARFRDVPSFFPGHKLNFAENLLMTHYLRAPDAIALTEVREVQLDNPENITWRELHHLVRITRAALIHHGVKESDVVAVLMSFSIWTIVLFLATASIGGIFTSISPDMGLSGCLSRLSQVHPVLLFADTDYAVRGARPSLIQKVRDILTGLPASQRKPTTVFVPTTHAPHTIKHSSQNPTIPSDLGMILSSFLDPTISEPSELEFNRVATSHPIFILYSSGTTGPPKCIVCPHISLINFRKVSTLHNSLTPQDTVFQYTSTSWILFQVSLGHLTNGVRLITFDGNPLHPDASTPLQICEKFDVTYWGTSPRYLLELEQQSSKPDSPTHPSKFNLNKLRMVTTTGAPLLPSQQRWFYDVFPNSKTIHLSSVAGGTDIASSWIASDPAGPLHENEMQMWALGHDCDVLSQDPELTKDSNGTSHFTYKSLATTGQPGELICHRPIPSMPVSFWGDDANKSKYMDAYFNRFPTTSGNQPKYLDVWAQHDLTLRNPSTSGIRILGRSDTTLNPSGIRFGSSEIYHIIESPPLNSLISDSLCVGRRRPHDTDESVFLFLIPAANTVIDDALCDRIRGAIRENLSPRHVPRFMYEVKEIPYTVNGKRVEGVVKSIVSGVDVVVSSTIRNPECLAEYRRFRDVERMSGASGRRERESKL